MNSSSSSLVLGLREATLPQVVELSRVATYLHTEYPDLRLNASMLPFHQEVLEHHPAIHSFRRWASPTTGLEKWEEAREAGVFAQVHFTENERTKWNRYIQERHIPLHAGADTRPLIVLSPWCGPSQRPFHVDFWDHVVREFQTRYRFWQLGYDGDSAVQGCEYFELPSPSPRHIRRLLYILTQSTAVIGVENELTLCAEPLQLSGCLFSPEPTPDFTEQAAQKQIHFFFDRLSETLSA